MESIAAIPSLLSAVRADSPLSCHPRHTGNILQIFCSGFSELDPPFLDVPSTLISSVYSPR